MNSKFKPILALLLTVLFWSLHAIIAKVTVSDLSPLTAHFLRVTIALFFFLPVFIAHKPWEKTKFSRLVLVSILSSANMIFFILGIKYTSASASQLIYAALPMLTLLATGIFLKQKYPKVKIYGVILGLLGVGYILYLSAVEKGETISGGLNGNLLIIIAMFAWLTYLMLSKELSRDFSPLEIGSVSIVCAFIIALPLFIGETIIFKPLYYFSIKSILGVFYMGFFGTFLTYILFQYAIKHLLTLTVTLASYIQPITTAVFAALLIGEKLTSSYLVGCILVFSGIFMSTSSHFYNKYKFQKL